MSCAWFEPYGEESLMSPLTNRPDKLLVNLDGLLDQAVRVVHGPRANFLDAIHAMHDGRYDATKPRFPRLEVHELLARDITAAVDAGVPERESEFLNRVSVRLLFEGSRAADKPQSSPSRGSGEERRSAAHAEREI
jgi:hypothetical protein